jgi:hypothetical protein
MKGKQRGYRHTVRKNNNEGEMNSAEGFEKMVRCGRPSFVRGRFHKILKPSGMQSARINLDALYIIMAPLPPSTLVYLIELVHNICPPT